MGLAALFSCFRLEVRLAEESTMFAELDTGGRLGRGTGIECRVAGAWYYRQSLVFCEGVADASEPGRCHLVRSSSCSFHFSSPYSLMCNYTLAVGVTQCREGMSLERDDDYIWTTDP